MLKLDTLPTATRKLFDEMAENDLLKDFTLIGGTALALQIGHRRSEDLDFWLPAERLNKGIVSTIVRSAQAGGFSTKLITPPHIITASKINGQDVLAFAQDYSIGGVKVQFFARNDLPYLGFDKYSRLTDSQTTFGVMSAEGLFVMKSWLIHQRTRSRDLFDLKAFMERGKTLQDILDAGSNADPGTSTEYAKLVLIGDVPLDKEDEGFAAIDVKETVHDIHDFFRKAVNEYEQSIAKHTLEELSPKLDGGQT